MSNKLAPYKDPAVIKQLSEFYRQSNVQTVMAGILPYDKEFLPAVYRCYLSWQATHPDVALETLNHPQFNKAFSIVVMGRDLTE